MKFESSTGPFAEMSEGCPFFWRGPSCPETEASHRFFYFMGSFLFCLRWKILLLILGMIGNNRVFEEGVVGATWFLGSGRCNHIPIASSYLITLHLTLSHKERSHRMCKSVQPHWFSISDLLKKNDYLNQITFIRC